MEGKAEWCKLCKQNKNDIYDEDAEEEGYVHGKLRWLTQDPGRQLLTGLILFKFKEFKEFVDVVVFVVVVVDILC